MQKTTTTLFSSLLALSILLLGAHATDVSALSANNPSHAKKFDDGSSATAQGARNAQDKAASDHLHNHVEKQTFKTMVKTVSDQSPQADQRHLRKVKPSARRDKHPLFHPLLALAGV